MSRPFSSSRPISFAEGTPPIPPTPASLNLSGLSPSSWPPRERRARLLAVAAGRKRWVRFGAKVETGDLKYTPIVYSINISYVQTLHDVLSIRCTEYIQRQSKILAYTAVVAAHLLSGCAELRDGSTPRLALKIRVLFACSRLVLWHDLGGCRVRVPGTSLGR